MIGNKVTENLTGMSPQGFFSSLVSVLINILFVFAAVFFFFNIVMGGIDWTNSGGDKGKLEQARQRVLNAVVGLVIVLSAYILVNFIAGIFNINLTSFDLSGLRIGGGS